MSAARQVKAKGLWLAAAVAAALLSGCAADKPKPAELQAVTAKIAGRQVWSASIGSVGFPMQPVLRGDRLFVASDDGTVAALDTANGREAWRAQVGARLSAGVGSDGRFSAVVTRDNELVVLEGAELRWRQKIDTAVVTAPSVRLVAVSSSRAGLPETWISIVWLRAIVLTKPAGTPAAAQFAARFGLLPMNRTSHGSCTKAKLCVAGWNRSPRVGTRTARE